MKRPITLTTAILVLGLGSTLSAGTFTWRPGPTADYDLNDLDHYMAITWRISPVNVPAGEVITGAKLTITNIYNWQTSATDRLFINLLDTAKIVTTATSSTTATDAYGVTYTTDSYPTISDYFDTSSNTDLVAGSTNRMSLAEPNPPVDAPGAPVGITYELDFASVPNALATLKTFVASGNDFAFGFDPDCHYYNSGLSFTLTTAPAAVPEPASVVLFGTMAAIVAHRLRKRSLA